MDGDPAWKPGSPLRGQATHPIFKWIETSSHLCGVCKMPRFSAGQTLAAPPAPSKDRSRPLFSRATRLA